MITIFCEMKYLPEATAVLITLNSYNELPSGKVLFVIMNDSLCTIGFPCA